MRFFIVTNNVTDLVWSNFHHWSGVCSLFVRSLFADPSHWKRRNSDYTASNR